jgi:hypothetical protein
MRGRRRVAILTAMDTHTTRFVVTVFVALAGTLVAICADAGEPRSRAVRSEVVRAEPCAAANPRWLPTAEGRGKTKVEVRLCRAR